MKTNTRKILIVDDEQEVCELLRTILEENGFAVTTVSDGVTALESIQKDIPGIVIIDLLLPGEHGINLIKSIKTDFFIPTIIISGIYRPAEINALMDEYFVEGFLEKPIDLSRLLETINSIINARTA